VSTLKNTLGLSPAYREAWNELGDNLGIKGQPLQMLRELMLEHGTREHEPYLPPGFELSDYFGGELLGALDPLPDGWRFRLMAVFPADQVIDDMADRHSIPPFEATAPRIAYDDSKGQLWMQIRIQTPQIDEGSPFDTRAGKRVYFAQNWPQWISLDPAGLAKQAWSQWMRTLGLEGPAAEIAKDIVLQHSDKLSGAMPPAMPIQWDLRSGPGAEVEPRAGQYAAALVLQNLPQIAMPDIFIPIGAPVYNFDQSLWVTAFYRVGRDRYPDLVTRNPI
jgi:hypothetical protein